MNYVEWHHELDTSALTVHGDLAVRRAEWAEAGFPVHLALCLNARAYRRFLQESGIEEKIRDIMLTADLRDRKGLESNCNLIHELFRTGALPRSILEQLMTCYAALSNMASQSGKGEALVELIMNEIGYKLPGGDLLNTRIGGCRHKINLVRGISKLEATIKREWSTFWTDWLGHWLEFPECDALNIDLAINIQQHLAPEYCGYVYSHPEKHPNAIFIGVSWGLWGEWFFYSWLPPHVSITTECDTYRIDRNTRRVLEVKIGNKKFYGACREDGTIVRKRVPYRKQKVPVLEESQIQELLFVHDRMEELYGGPTSISWKYDKGEFFII